MNSVVVPYCLPREVEVCAVLAPCLFKGRLNRCSEEVLKACIGATDAFIDRCRNQGDVLVVHDEPLLLDYHPRFPTRPSVQVYCDGYERPGRHEKSLYTIDFSQTMQSL